jgi:predicted short-subunit dehydrogenase-like oxidoreductase (DUF2520 family)
MSKAFRKNDISILGVYARNEIEGRSIAKKAKTKYFDQLKSIPQNADVYLICVSDDAIRLVVADLPKSIKKSKIVAHTSGSKSIEKTLLNCKKAGVFYPLQTFTKGKKMNYNNIPFCVNATTNQTINVLTNLGNKISTSVQTINDNQRKSIHLSAVMINNFVNHLIFSAQDLLEQNDMDAGILQPLLLETIKKQKSLGAYHAQTGPARRLDSKTLEAHLQLLQTNIEYQSMYKAISKSIQKTYNKKK